MAGERVTVAKVPLSKTEARDIDRAAGRQGLTRAAYMRVASLDVARGRPTPSTVAVAPEKPPLRATGIIRTPADALRAVAPLTKSFDPDA